jgi:hypothetical protein
VSVVLAVVAVAGVVAVAEVGENPIRPLVVITEEHPV